MKSAGVDCRCVQGKGMFSPRLTHSHWLAVSVMLRWHGVSACVKSDEQWEAGKHILHPTNENAQCRQREGERERERERERESSACTLGKHTVNILYLWSDPYYTLSVILALSAPLKCIFEVQISCPAHNLKTRRMIINWANPLPILAFLNSVFVHPPWL